MSTFNVRQRGARKKANIDHYGFLGHGRHMQLFLYNGTEGLSSNPTVRLNICNDEHEPDSVCVTAI